MDRNHYRRDAIKKWKKKKSKRRFFLASNDSSNSKTTQSSLALGETSDYVRRRVNNKGGKHLLQQVPFTADVLPDVRCCRYCDAVKFYSETENFCCLNGRIVLSSNELPTLMQDLLTSTSKEAQSFRTYIRTYNNHFAFTSLGVKADTNLSKRNKGIYTFRVQGQIYHFINTLSPQENDVKNLQLYFHDTDHEMENRLLVAPRLCRHLIAKCVEYLQENPYARFFRNLRDVSDLDEYKIILKTIPGQDQRVFNKPEVSQVAALWVEGEENGEHSRRNIEVKLHSDCSRSVEYYYGCYDPLQYPLMFPFGELGWHQHIPKKKETDKGNKRDIVCTTDKLISPVTAVSAEYLLDMEQNVLDRNSESSKYVSVREYYAYKLQMRRHDKSHLLHFGRLLQQYIVDSYVKLETQRLTFFRTQQDDIRQEFLQGIVDAMASGENEASTIGRRVVLPANFIGGPRNMRRKYIDAMALVQKFGKPDIFLTLTCNPNWPEIKQHMMSHEEAHNRADLVVRVFHAKLELFKNELLKNNIFGKIAAYTYVVEFQKRGLPHAHFLLILERDFKMYDPEEYDEIVCAEIPDENLNPRLYNMVVKHMLHGPCGNLNPNNVCMKNGTCKNSYPKDFCNETTQSKDAYPTYRR